MGLVNRRQWLAGALATAAPPLPAGAQANTVTTLDSETPFNTERPRGRTEAYLVGPKGAMARWRP